MTDATARVPLLRPLTPREEHVVELVAQELSYQEIAERLNISVRTVWSHIEAASAKIPGTLKPKARIVCWWRGAPRQVLS